MVDSIETIDWRSRCSAIEGLGVMSPATVVGGRVFERWRGQRKSGFVGEHDQLGAVAGVELDPWRG
jgi:hypothetical protein